MNWWKRGLRTPHFSFACLLIAAVVIPPTPTILSLHRTLVSDTSLGDLATEEMGVLEAVHSVRFVGQWSRYEFFQPGPLFYYAMVPTYVLAGQRPWGLALGMFLLCWTSMLALCVLCSQQLERWSGVALAVPAMACTLAYLTTDGHSILFGYWTNFAIVLPNATLLLLAASLAAGRLWALPLLVGVSSLLVQTQAATMPTVLAIVLTSVFLLLRRRRSWNSGGSSPRPWLASSGLILAAAWSLPVYEELAHRPGNFSTMAAFARTPYQAHSSAEAFASWSQAFAGPLTRPLYGLTWQTPLQGSKLIVAECIAGTLVGLLVAGAALARRREHRASEALCVLCAVAATTSLWSLTQIRGELLRYLTLWIAAVGAVSSVAVLNETLTSLAFGRRKNETAPRIRRWLLASLVAPAAVLLAAPAPTTLSRAGVSSMTKVLEELLLEERGSALQVRLVSDDFTWPWTSAIATALYREGWRPCFDRSLHWITPWWECEAQPARSIRFFEPEKSAAAGKLLFCQAFTPSMLGVRTVCAEEALAKLPGTIVPPRHVALFLPDVPLSGPQKRRD